MTVKKSVAICGSALFLCRRIKIKKQNLFETLLAAGVSIIYNNSEKEDRGRYQGWKET